MANVFWDTFDNDAFFGGTGVWNTTTNNWSQAPNYVRGTFTQGDFVTFQGIAGDVTLGLDVTVAGMFFSGQNTVISGTNSVTVQSGGTIDVNGGTFGAIDAVLAGSDDFSVEGLLRLGGQNTYTGTISISSGIIYISGTHMGDIVSSSTGTLNVSGTMTGDFHSGTTNTARISGEMAGDIIYQFSGSVWVFSGGEISGRVLGNEGNQTIEFFTGSVGSGNMRMGAGIDTIEIAGAVSGTVRLGAGDDILDATDGIISGAIVAGRGDDEVTGSNDANLIRGAAGRDTLNGLGGNDRIEGGKSRDVIDGGADNDLIYGDGGNDILTGGTGADVFMYRDLSDLTGGGPAERITDFTQGEDLIRLLPVDADSTVAGRQAFTFIGNAGFSGTAGELRAKIQTDQTVIRGDVDGDGVADFALVLTGEMVLTGADFLL